MSIFPKISWHHLAVFCLSLLLVVSFVTPVHAANPTQIYWGAIVDGQDLGFSDNPPWDMRGLDKFEQDAGKKVAIFQWGMAWKGPSGYEDFDVDIMNAVRSRGSIPMVDWRSWNYEGSEKTQSQFRLSAVIRGDHDAYIRKWATDAKNWGHPFFIRYNPEMNGDWYLWSEVNNGNSAGQYVQAWRHVHDIFTSVGATNVSWVWAPNVVDQGEGSSTPTPLASLYPGDAYVDWTAMDGYNWSTVQGEPWKSFSTIFKPTYDQILTIAPCKPMMIAETSSSEKGAPSGQSKATWFTDALSTQLPNNFPAVRAFLLFNDNDDGADWVIETSASAQNAFKAGIGSSYYASNTFGAQTASPIQPLGTTLCGGGTTPSPSPVATPTPNSSPSPVATPTPGVSPSPGASSQPTATPSMLPSTSPSGTPTGPQCEKADFNLDGRVDRKDYQLLAGGFFRRGSSTASAKLDLNNDNHVDLRDFSLFIRKLGRRSRCR